MPTTMPSRLVQPQYKSAQCLATALKVSFATVPAPRGKSRVAPIEPTRRRTPGGMPTATGPRRDKRSRGGQSYGSATRVDSGSGSEESKEHQRDNEEISLVLPDDCA